jgi:hypothetical protein
MSVLSTSAVDRLTRERFGEPDRRVCADEGLEHSWTSRVLARLSGRHALNGRDRLGDALRAQGFGLR